MGAVPKHRGADEFGSILLFASSKWLCVACNTVLDHRGGVGHICARGFYLWPSAPDRWTKVGIALVAGLHGDRACGHGSVAQSASFGGRRWPEWMGWRNSLGAPC